MGNRLAEQNYFSQNYININKLVVDWWIYDIYQLNTTLHDMYLVYTTSIDQKGGVSWKVKFLIRSCWRLV